MADYIDFFYITRLYLTTAILLTLFYGFGDASRKFKLGLSGIVGGFVMFLAANELLALPFMLLHWSFRLYLPLFLLLNAPFLVFGLKAAWRKLQSSDWRSAKKPSLQFALAAMAVLACLLIPQFIVKYQADDSFYLSLAELNKHSSELYSYDPATGNADLEFPKTYMFEGWELMQSALSTVTGLTTLEFAHGLLMILVIALSLLAHSKIFRTYLNDRNQIYIAMLFLSIILVFGGYSIYSQGTFLLTRPWVGKSIIAMVIVPLLFYLLLKIYKSSKNHTAYLAIGITNVAAVALNPTAIYLNLALISVFALMMLMKTKKIKTPIKLGASTIPLLTAGGVVFATSIFGAQTLSSDYETRSGGRSYADFAMAFFGDFQMIALYTVALTALFLLRKKEFRKLAPLAIVFPLILFATFLNPLFISPIKALAADNTYWRFMWLIPITIALPVAFVYLIDPLKKSVAYIAGTSRSTSTWIGVVLLAFTLVSAGTFLFMPSQQYFAFNPTKQKTPEGVTGVAEFLANQPEGVVFASEHPSTYLHTYTSKHELLVSRELYIQVHFSKNSDDYIDRLAMLYVVHSIEFMPEEELNTLLKKYGVEYVVYPAENKYLSDFGQDFGYESIYENENYKVLEI